MRTFTLTLNALAAIICLMAWLPVAAADEVTTEEPPSDGIWLPTILVNYQNLYVNPKNRQESLNFYNDTYLASSNVDPQWTGRYNTCDAG